MKKIVFLLGLLLLNAMIVGAVPNKFDQHDGRVNSVAFSPDGKTIVSGSADKTIKLWRTVDKKCMGTISGHRDSVTCVAFSPNSQTIVSGSADKTIKIWNVSNASCVRVIENNSSVVFLSFMPDGKSIVSLGRDGNVKVWRLNGDCVQSFKVNGLAASLSSNGQQLAVDAGWSIQLFDLGTNLMIQSLTGQFTCYSLTFSPDGKVLATSKINNAVKLWRLSDGAFFQLFDTSGPSVMAFSPDGKLLAIDDGWTVKLWRLSGSTLLTTFTSGKDGSHAVAFSPDGKKIVSTGKNSIIVYGDFPK